MTLRLERIFGESLPKLPETELGRLVTTYAEQALEKGTVTLPIKESDVESFRDDVRALLQPCDLPMPYTKRSKKPHRNLVAAIHEALYHDPRFQGQILLVVEEIPEQPKPWIPTHLRRIIMIHRDSLEADPGPDVYCVTETVRKREGRAPTGRKQRLYKLKEGLQI